jgi:hypothetical protein
LAALSANRQVAVEDDHVASPDDICLTITVRLLSSAACYDWRGRSATDHLEPNSR